MVKAKNKISNNLYFNVKGHFGMLNEVKELKTVNEIIY